MSITPATPTKGHTMNISNEVLADAGLTLEVLKTVKREISGTNKEALEHWRMISDRVRNYYKEATPSYQTAPPVAHWPTQTRNQP